MKLISSRRFDPKTKLAHLKKKELPPSILTESEVKRDALKGELLYKSLH
jgi:hypothetical protein